MIEALYIHVPFCVSRCGYCDFATSACVDDARMDAYVDALSLQMRRAAKAGLLGGVRTVYIGGGTPTHLGSRRLNSLAYMISLSINLENVVEFTCEANPESIEERMVADLFALGVDRFSLGVQSFDDSELEAFGRAHDARAVDDALAAIRTRTTDVSIDLICGGPGQTLDSWMDTLRRALAADVPHVSVYPLMLEEGTQLSMRVEAGEVAVPDEEAQADMMELARDVLEEAGLERYEVASYARSGHESRHNAAYWTGVEYLGLGAGASSMLAAETFETACEAGVFDGGSVADTLTMLEDQLRSDDPIARVRVDASADDRAFSASLGSPAVEVELMSAREASVEDLMLGMRRSVGVSLEHVRSVAGARGVFDDLVDRGLVREKEGRYVPTERGWLMGNEVFGAIWDLAAKAAEHV